MRPHFVIFALALLVFPSQATGMIANWSNALEFRTASGVVNPGMLVAFNPQPEPPAYLVPLNVDLSNSQRPSLTIPDIAVSEGQATILMAFAEGFEIDAAGVPDGETFTFQLLSNFGGVPTVQDVNLSMSTGSGGSPAPGSWVMFNPQPEPPAGLNAIGFDFGFTSNSPATLIVEMTSIQGKALDFELLPAADFNDDLAVDRRDYLIWRSNYGIANGGDATRDDLTAGDDLLRWQQQFAPAGELAAVPEPATWVGILLGGGCLRLARRRSFRVRCEPAGRSRYSDL